MKWDKVKEMNSSAFGRWYRLRFDTQVSTERRKKFYSKYTSCGKSFTRFGRVNYSYCHSMICPRCCSRFSRKLANKFVSQYPKGYRHNYTSVTIGLGYALSADSAILMMRDFRDKLSKSIHAKKGRKSARMQPWKDFGFVGCLDFYCFKAEDFGRLGEDKRRQFIDNYKFDPNNIRGTIVYDVHIHGVYYNDGLKDDDIHAVLLKYSKSLYCKPLGRVGSIGYNVREYMIYSTKVRYCSRMGNGIPVYWSQDAIRGLADVASCYNGQQSRKMMIGRSGKVWGKDSIS